MIQPAPQYLQTAKVCDANKAADAPPRYRGLSYFGHVLSVIIRVSWY